MSYRKLILSLLTISISVAFSVAEEAPKNKRNTYPPMVERIHEKLAKLDLSEDQKPKVDVILKDAADQITKLRNQANGDLENFRADASRVFITMRNQLETVLTPEQLKQLQDSMPRRFGPQGDKNDKPSTVPTAPSMEMNSPDTKGQVPQKSPTTKPVEDRLQIGQPAPDFTLKRTDGRSVASSSFKGRPTVLLFGSITSPTFRSKVLGFEDLKQDFRNKANVYIIYTREAYPVNEWEVQRNEDDQVKVNQPASIAERNKLAIQTRESAKISIEILVDDIDDAVATAYDAMPNGCVLIDSSGKVVFKQKWADAWGMRAALDSTLKAR